MVSRNSIDSPHTESFLSADGWYKFARKVPSPNFNCRPENTDVDLIIIHCICLPPFELGAGDYAADDYVEPFFCNRLDTAIHPYFAEIENVEVSAHFYIRRNGEITQFVATKDRAWHAGASCFDGIENCNDYSVGIELEGLDSDCFTVQQYEVLTELCQHLIAKYPKINKNRIAGHSQIAPGRKTDPGPGFDWERFLGALC